jgi:large subunit ribosomal protein L9
MKVLLIQDVENLGLAGEVYDVAGGYGRNYLLPQGLAVLATPGALKDAEVHRRRAAKRRERIAAEMADLAGRISQVSLTFYEKAGEKGRLYGSVTNIDVAEKLSEVIGQEIDRRKIVIDNPIKQVGTHTVKMRLNADLVPEFDVVVEPEEEVLEESEASEESEVSEEPEASESDVSESKASEPVAEEQTEAPAPEASEAVAETQN